MFRDIKAGAAVEADHVIGDLIARADAAKVPVPRLRTAYTHLKAYERQRERAWDDPIAPLEGEPRDDERPVVQCVRFTDARDNARAR